MSIRTTEDSDLPQVLDIHRRAFGQDAEAELVRDILADPTAQPTLSLLATESGQPLGHVLFSTARLAPPEDDVSVMLLAPLAVDPRAQGKGHGSKLMDEGLARLTRLRTDLVFVLGDPGFYGRFGFMPADRLGLAAPFPLTEAYLDAWRVKFLHEAPHRRWQGQVICCDVLNRQELWQES